MPTTDDNLLGAFLKDRRARLDPTTFGFGQTRRRTPGLRREEVAQRANVSATWYTWLEQGRGGAPSTDVLERVAGALTLSEAEREHLFLLAQRRPPEMRPRAPESVTGRLQLVLDALPYSPAMVKNATWDIIAWNHAAETVMIGYRSLPPERRNVLRMLFHDPSWETYMPDWEKHARSSVATFRLATARAGSSEAARALVDELSAMSPAFRRIWNENDVSDHGEGTKTLVNPAVGQIAMEYSTFAVDGHPDLGLVIYTPATAADFEKVRSLVDAAREPVLARRTG
jgi:transcriptional regulator with XRE-family HTH domain